MHFLGILIVLNLGLGSAAFTLLYKAKNVRPRGFGTAKHALIIGIDGLGGIHMKNFSNHLPTIQTFLKKGAYTTEARNIAPTVSAPNWAAYLTSMGATQTGVYDKDWTPMYGDPPGNEENLPPISGRGLPKTLFSIVKDKDPNAKTVLSFTMEWFLQLAKHVPDIDYWFWGHEGITCGKKESESDCSNRQDWNTMNKTVEAIKKDQPTLTFIQFDAVDQAGHKSYWGSPLYYKMVKEKDKQIACILDALAATKTSSGKSMIEDTMVAVVADHGGYQDTHRTTPPMIAEVYVPILLRGPGILNINLDNPLAYRDISTLDLPVTVLNALGIEPGKYMRGRILEEIYGP